MGILQLDIGGNPFIGVWCSANNNFAFVPRNATKSNVRKIRKALDVETVQTNIGGTNLIGTLIALNSNGVIVTNFIEEKELAELGNHIKVGVLKHKLNAVGNIILANDKAVMIHPDLDRRAVELVKDTLEVDCDFGTIAGLKTVGAAAAVTNKGLLCHPKVTDDERSYLGSHFDVPVEIGTANYGTPLIGACIIANEKGAITGFTSTGIELGRIESALDLI